MPDGTGITRIDIGNTISVLHQFSVHQSQARFSFFRLSYAMIARSKTENLTPTQSPLVDMCVVSKKTLEISLKDAMSTLF